MARLEGVDPRNLARVRTQVWFASEALKGMVASSGGFAMSLDEQLGPVVRLLDLAQIKLSDLIDGGQVVTPEGLPRDAEPGKFYAVGPEPTGQR